MASTRRPRFRASQAPRLATGVVLALPPFSLMNAIRRGMVALRRPRRRASGQPAMIVRGLAVQRFRSSSQRRLGRRAPPPERRRVALARPRGSRSKRRVSTSKPRRFEVAGPGIAHPGRRTPWLERQPGRLRGETPFACGDQPPFAALTALVSAGTISNRSATTPMSATSKIGASGSLLMAMMKFEPFMPTRCWIAPEMPTAM